MDFVNLLSFHYSDELYKQHLVLLLIRLISNSLSSLSVTISKCSNPKNPHLNPKPKADDDSGSNEKLASFNCNLAKPSFNF